MLSDFQVAVNYLPFTMSSKGRWCLCEGENEERCFEQRQKEVLYFFRRSTFSCTLFLRIWNYPSMGVHYIEIYVDRVPAAIKPCTWKWPWLKGRNLQLSEDMSTVNRCEPNTKHKAFQMASHMTNYYCYVLYCVFGSQLNIKLSTMLRVVH